MDKSTTFGTSTFRKRVLSFVLVLVMLLGLLPTAVLNATAADVPAQVKLVNAKYGYSQSGNSFVSYTSPNGNINNAYFHYFTMDVNGSVVPGMCLEHQKHMGVSYEGQVWENPTLSTLPSGVLRFLDYYYFKVDEHQKAHAETNTACTNAIDSDLKNCKYGDQYKNMWSQFDLEFTNAVFQAVVWLAREGKIKDPINDTTEQEMIAKERYAVGEKVFGDRFVADMEGCRDWVGWQPGNID